MPDPVKRPEAKKDDSMKMQKEMLANHSDLARARRTAAGRTPCATTPPSSC